MFCPDVLAVRDVESYPRDKWVVSAEGKGLELILEVHVLGDRAKDFETNVKRYARLGVPEYFAFDRNRMRLAGWRLPDPEARSYVPIVPQAGRFASAILGLELALEQDRIRFYLRHRAAGRGRGARPAARTRRRRRHRARRRGGEARAARGRARE